jgi:hypothetical protein
VPLTLQYGLRRKERVRFQDGNKRAAFEVPEGAVDLDRFGPGGTGA